ncbi:MaoC family dehydratase [Ketobacter nezhaii]|uniref:MaoC family dehydratase n=1 Tax=Ketobacter sp. MCCC 1A13808 TaxID=2602738 RepID=UPI0018DE8411|nr:MaoC/PaaZ C-terminal domain-containing protein [Ketobacter sp. MCCC 1A13808]
MMATIELEKAPSTMSLYYRAVTGKKAGKMQGDTLPTIKANLKGVCADLKKLNQYRKVCGFPVSGSLPVTYPHILAFPLHMEILVNPLFPFPLLGLVHVKNEITQYRAIGNQEVLDIECELTGPEAVSKGLEFSILTRVSVGGKLVWESTSTNLYRTKQGASGAKEEKKKSDTFSADNMVYWDVPENTGRRYAKVSGDSNLIHLYAVTAKLFGFPRAIAHGMWNKAHVIGALDEQLPNGPFRVSVAFKLPVFLPSEVQFLYANTGDTIEFRVKDKKGEKPHLSGTIQAL